MRSGHSYLSGNVIGPGQGGEGGVGNLFGADKLRCGK